MLWPIGLALAIISALLFFNHHYNRALTSPRVLQWSVIVYGWLAYAGVLNTHWANPTTHKHHYSQTAHIPGLLLARINEVPVEKNASYQANVTILGKMMSGNLEPQSGKAMLNLPADSQSNRLTYGDLVVVNTSLQPIEPPKNPYEFDYAGYLANKHIHHQLRPKADRWYATGENTANGFYAWMFNIHLKALSILQAHLPEREQFGVAAAMLLGHRAHLDAEVRQRYTLTGAMHVLAVSGMHVGLLFFMLGWVVLPLQYFKKPWLRLVLLLSIIWLYALLTGGSPSVLRASLMFSLFALGQTMLKKPNSLNILASSALILLLIEPRQLLDVGFQLSYLAVLGIIFFYRPLVNLWPIKNKVARFFWQGTCVSIAAQVATLPLVLYYFHQIPLYALLANLGLLLLAPAVMFCGFAVLVLNGVPGLSWALGKLLWGLLWVLNEMLLLIASMPNAAWKAIYPSPLEVLAGLGLLLSVAVALQMSWVKPTIAAGYFILLLLLVNTTKVYDQKQQQTLIVYQYPQQTAIAGIQGPSASLWADSLALSDTAIMERSVYPYLHANGTQVPDVTVLTPQKTNHYFTVGDKRIALLRDYSRRNLPKEKLEVDYLILANTPKLDMKVLEQVYSAGHIVFDGSNNVQTAQRWMQECKVLGLTCHNTRTGAFISSW
jgi:competence protein ComEC